MTIQFRSRLKSVVDYTSELTSFGICCQYNKISGEYTKFKSTANQCYANQGSESNITKTFYPGVTDNETFTCTESSTEKGCCCACKYAKESENYQDFLEDGNLLPVNSGDKCEYESTDTDIALHFDVGLRDDVEQCECQRLGGKWTAGPCPTESGNDVTDAQSIRTYCYGAVTVIPPDEEDPDDPDPQQLGTCCYNCASNEDGRPADCSCCEQNTEQGRCQNTLAGFWRSNYTDSDGSTVQPSCDGCVTAPVYGVCYSQSTGNCWSVWSNDIDPNLSDQDIRDRLCKSDISSGNISIDHGDEIFVRNQTCASARESKGANPKNFPKIFRKLDCDANPGCLCGGDCTEIASTTSETGGGAIYLKSCYMGLNLPDANGVVSVSEKVPEWQLLYNSKRRISDDIWTEDRNVGPWFCGPCQSEDLTEEGKFLAANNFKMTYPLSSTVSTQRTCGERGYYHKIEKQGLNYNLSVTQVPATTDSTKFTCTSKIYDPDPNQGFKHGFGKCERTEYLEVNSDTTQAYFTYAPQPNVLLTDFSDVYTEEFGWGHGVCCNYNAKTCEFTFQHNCFDTFDTFTNWKNLLRRLKKNVPSFVNIFQESPEEQLTLVQDYFNQKKCLDSLGNVIVCEACDAVCDFIGYACTVPCNSSGCQCQKTTYDLYTTQKCPSNCTDCATQVAGSGCCKRWYGPDDNQCEGSTQYTTVSCDIPEPPVLGICCNRSKPTNPCVFDIPVEKSKCQHEWIEGATDCTSCSSNLIACCDHRYNTCTPDVEPQNCQDYFYERPALDSNGNPVNDCSKCNFEAIDIPNCVNLNSSIIAQKPTCIGNTVEKNKCLCATGICCKGDGTPNPSGSGGLADEATCFTVNDIEWKFNNQTNTYYPESLTCGAGANKLDPLYLTDSVVGGNELEVYSPCYASANEQFSSDIYSPAPSNLVSGDAIPYGVCCQYKEIDENTIEPNGCALVKATRNYCAGKLSEGITDPNIKNRWIASYYECKDIWVYQLPANPPNSICTTQITLPKYDCDICTKIVGNVDTATDPDYYYPGTSFRTNLGGILIDYYDYMPGTLPSKTAMKACESCYETLLIKWYNNFFTFKNKFTKSKYYFNERGADYLQARITKNACLNPNDENEDITEDCCNNQVIIPTSGVYDDSYMTLKQNWNDNRYTRTSCKCNTDYNPSECFCEISNKCDATEEELEEFCGVVPDNGLCCGTNACAGILTEAECTNRGSEYTWYNNTPYDDNANCPSSDPCTLGVCCRGSECDKNVRRFECSSPDTFVSYANNPQGCSTNPCSMETGRCCAYATLDPLNTLSASNTSCSILTESACLNMTESTGSDGTSFSVKSVFWKQGENCTNKQFTFQFKNTKGELQTITTSSNPCLIGTCCTGNLDQGTESCLGLTAAYNCPGNATAGSGGLKFISGNSNCSTPNESSCNLSLCCTGFDTTGNLIWDGTGSSTTTYQTCNEDTSLDNTFYLGCSFPTLGGLPLSEPSLCEWGVCCKTTGQCLGLRRRINCLYTCGGDLEANPNNIFVPKENLGAKFDQSKPCEVASLATNWCDKGICCVKGNCVSGTRGQCYELDGSDFRVGDTCNSNPNHCKMGYYCPNTGSNCTLLECIPPNVSCLQDNQQGFSVLYNTLHKSEWSPYPFTKNVTTCSDACDPSLGSCCSPNAQTCNTDILESDCPSGWSINNNCTDCKGACCSSEGGCSFVTKTQCDASGGIYKGNAVTCESNPCFGACCCLGLETSCTSATNTGTTKSARDNCNDICIDAGSGSIYVNNKTCQESPCKGACCDGSSGSCSQETPAKCASSSGSKYFGNGRQCDPFICNGACCNNSTGSCSDVKKSSCNTTTSTFKGFGTFCEDEPPPCQVPTGSCCVTSTGSCSVTTFIACCPSLDCTSDGKVWTQNGNCSPNPCVQPKVACCFASSNSCNSTTHDAITCVAAGGSPLSLGETCNDCVGSCCVGDDQATCTDNVRKSACVNTGQPCNPPKHTIGKSCSQVTCTLPTYPCCSGQNGVISCSKTTLENCNNIGGKRAGECTESCNPNTCAGVAACCFPDGTCYEEFLNLCEDDGGTPYSGQSCKQANCQPAGSFSCCTYTNTPGCSGGASSNVVCENVSSSDECPSEPIITSITISCDDDGNGVYEEKVVKKVITKHFNFYSACVGNDCDACINVAPGASECLVQCCYDGRPGGCVYETECLNTLGTPSGPCNGDCGTNPGALIDLGAPSTSSTCSYCCGCVDGRVRDCCFEKVDGRFVCDAEINSSQNKGICEANQSHGSYCDTTQEIPVCAWVENNQTQYSNHRCVTLTDCEGTYTGTTKVSTSGSALVLKAGQEEIECYVDKRIPRSCCYIAYDANDFPVGITCENVCTSIECETKSPVYSEVATTNLGAFNCIDDTYNFDNTDGGYCRTWCACGKSFDLNGDPRCYGTNDTEDVDFGVPPGFRYCGSIQSNAEDTYNITTLTPKEASYPSIFNTGALCGKELLEGKGSFNCGLETEGFLLKSSYRFSSNYLRDINTGTCFNLVKNDDGTYEYECDLSFKTDCTAKGGYFVTLVDSGNNICTGSHVPTAPQFDTNQQLIAQTMSETDFLNEGLLFGDYKWGGYFVGIFKPGETQVYGSDPETLDRPLYRKSKISSYGKSTGKGWALFIQDVSYKVRYFDPRNEQSLRVSNKTSMHDGFNNCYKTQFVETGNLFKKFYLINAGGFADYYLPSLEEMEFLASKLHEDPENYFTYLKKLHRGDIDNSVFWTSSAFNTNLVYATYLDVENVKDFGKVVLVPAHSREIYNAFFVRRIELT